MLRKVKIYSVVPLSDLSPACPLRILWSIPMQMRSITILPNILLTTYRRVIPRHFLHSLDFPFFGILLMTLLIHLSGTFFRLQIMSISSFTLSVVNSRSAFSSSTVIISLPGDLLSFAHRSRVYASYALLFTIFFTDPVGWLLPMEYLHQILSLPLSLLSYCKPSLRCRLPSVSSSSSSFLCNILNLFLSSKLNCLLHPSFCTF